jgi:FixJ family two-component response regulator
MKSLLEIFGYEVLSYNSGADFLADDRHRGTACLVIDQHMPDMDGLDVVDCLRKQGARVRCRYSRYI